MSIDELTDNEAAELGLLVRSVSLALREVTGCVKTYVIQFAEHEEHPRVHFHIVPRMAINLKIAEAPRSLPIWGFLKKKV